MPDKKGEYVPLPLTNAVHRSHYRRFQWTVLAASLIVSVLISLPKAWLPLWSTRNTTNLSEKDQFLDSLISNMTVPELLMQMHMMFSDYIVGINGDNADYDDATSPAPHAGLGVIHDWYPTNSTQFNSLQELHLNKSRLPIPFLQTGECLHGVGSFKQSLFPQSIGMSASWDTDLVYRVGRAIGTEARSIGIHACFSPVLDLGKEPRWGRVQEDWGEDYVLTSHMGVAYSSGLSKNSNWSAPDAVVPVMKHFAGYGSPQGGVNTAPFMGRGMREVKQELLIPFRDAVQKGGVRGVMMAYSEIDEIPSHIHPVLYESLEEWGFDGFTMADDTGMRNLENQLVANGSADAIQQWFNAGGMLQFYDYPLSTFIQVGQDLVSSNTVPLATLQSHARHMLSVKYDLGLFHDPYIPSSIDSAAITRSHVPLTLEAAHKSIVLLENRDNALPIRPSAQGIKKIALVGPYADTFNFGDYSGPWGALPNDNSSTIRQAMLAYLQANASSVELVTSWGANNWNYKAQYPIPGYLLSTPNTTVNGSLSGGLLATYFGNTNFTNPIFQKVETPNRDWGFYAPNGLPSTSFSAIWEGEFEVPSDAEGYIGAAVYINNTASVFVDNVLVAESPFSGGSNVLSQIPGPGYDPNVAPPGSGEFSFVKGAKHTIRIEFQAFNTGPKFDNAHNHDAEIELFWNLVDRNDAVATAVDVAQDADLIVLTVGANWNSDGEWGDRATFSLSANQTRLTDAMFALGKPVILILEGGRPFAIPQYYSRAAAVLNAFFPGQQGGQAISDVLFGVFSPGGRLPLSIASAEGILPVFYNYKGQAHARDYVDINPYPTYSFGYGLSYTTFSATNFVGFSSDGSQTFTAGETITFTTNVTNTGSLEGSYVAQVYLLSRVSTLTRVLRQLVAFSRVYLSPGESQVVSMELEVDRFLPILDRQYNWVLETGDYTFALMDNGGPFTFVGVQAKLTCVSAK